MKKSLFLGVLVAVIALVACNPKPTTEYTKLAFTQTAVEVGVDGTLQLYLEWEPIALADPTTKCTWTSSDPSVAVVNQGMVTGVAEGECEITATIGDLKATAKVTVVAADDLERKNLEFGSYVLYNWNPQYAEQYIIERDVKVEISIGEVNCYLQYRPFYFLGSNIYLTEDAILGADYEIYALVPIYIIDEPATSANAKYNGYYIGSDYQIGGQAGPYVAEAGHINDFNAYATFLDKYMLEEDIEYAQAHAAEDYFNNLAGAIFQYHDYDAEEEDPEVDGTSWTLGLVTDGIFGDDENRDLLYANVNVRWFDDFFGLKVNDEGTDLVRPYEFVYTDIVYANVELQEQAPRKVAAKKAAQAKLTQQYNTLKAQQGENVTAKCIR